MTIYYQDDAVTLHHGDCIEVMRSLPDASVDAVVTDPPYGLEFMGREWDAPWKSSGTVEASIAEGADESHPYRDGSARIRYGRGGSSSAAFGDWCELWATECLRVLKPGGHLLAFGGSRTWHRLAVAVEDAGFEIRDSIAWLHGSGFPKSLDVSKAIDKAAGAEREVTRHALVADDTRPIHVDFDPRASQDRERRDFPATPDAQRWQGWGTALKPAFEPIVVGRKPLTGTVAANVLEHGTGALNVDGCRVGTDERLNGSSGAPGANAYRLTGGDGRDAENARAYAERSKALPPTLVTGRCPANVILDEHAAAELDEQSGELTSGVLATHHQRAPKEAGILGAYGSAEGERGYGDTGGASRFFYVAKADRNERPKVGGVAHPTVKPLDLMRWLVRLVTPPGGTVLDPFAGSGTTVEACIVEGFRCIAIEKGDEYLPLIESRITRRRDPVRHVELTGADPGLFDFLGGEAS